MLRTGLKDVVPLKQIPHWQYVDNYIKAHYLFELELLDWVRLTPTHMIIMPGGSR